MHNAKDDLIYFNRKINVVIEKRVSMEMFVTTLKKRVCRYVQRDLTKKCLPTETEGYLKASVDGNQCLCLEKTEARTGIEIPEKCLSIEWVLKYHTI